MRVDVGGVPEPLVCPAFPLVGVLGDVWSYRGAMLVPMVLVLVTLVYARSFAPEPDRYGGGHERPSTADVGRGGNGL